MVQQVSLSGQRMVSLTVEKLPYASTPMLMIQNINITLQLIEVAVEASEMFWKLWSCPDQVAT